MKRDLKSPEYRAWACMRGRCFCRTHRDFNLWGGRGITICPEWSDFFVFLRDMGPRPSDKHSLDRINNEGNYEPRNCRWATDIQQGNNTRSCKNVTAFGMTKTLAGWSRVTGLHASQIYRRLQSGMSVNEALTKATINPRSKFNPSWIKEMIVRLAKAWATLDPDAAYEGLQAASIEIAVKL